MTVDRVRARPLLAAVGLILAALALAACNTLAALDDEVIEQNIRDELQSQVGVTLTSVDCPADRPLLAGDVFECTATGSDGRELVITVTQDDAAGNVNWEVTAESFPSPTP